MKVPLDIEPWTRRERVFFWFQNHQPFRFCLQALFVLMLLGLALIPRRSRIWFARKVGLLVCLLVILAAGCTPPTVRVKTVHIMTPPAKNTADVAVRYKGFEFTVSVEIERIVREVEVSPDG